MGRSNRSRRGRPTAQTARRSLPTQRFVPYGSQQKNFRRFAPNINSSRGKIGNRARTVRSSRLRVLQRPPVQKRSRPWTSAVRMLQSTVVLQPEADRAESKRFTVCEARSRRKEVLHAVGQAGRKGQKTPRWTARSKVRCK